LLLVTFSYELLYLLWIRAFRFSLWHFLNHSVKHLLQFWNDQLVILYTYGFRGSLSASITFRFCLVWLAMKASTYFTRSSFPNSFFDYLTIVTSARGMFNFVGADLSMTSLPGFKDSSSIDFLYFRCARAKVYSALLHK
jgi:hypothetical protein